MKDVISRPEVVGYHELIQGFLNASRMFSIDEVNEIKHSQPAIAGRLWYVGLSPLTVAQSVVVFVIAGETVDLAVQSRAPALLETTAVIDRHE